MIYIIAKKRIIITIRILKNDLKINNKNLFSVILANAPIEKYSNHITNDNIIILNQLNSI